MNPSHFAVLIATHNSPNRLRLICSQFKNRGIRVHVSDSSNQPTIGLSGESIDYTFVPDHGLVKKLHDALQLIDEPYVLLHPDGELLNPNLTSMLLRAQGQSNAVSFLGMNLNMERRGESIRVGIRNFLSFKYMSQSLSLGKIEATRYLSPYHQLLWGVHRTTIATDFFSRAKDVDWFGRDGVNVTLFERVFNMFMLHNGRVLVFDEPTYMRSVEHSVSRATYPRLCHVDEWLREYRAGDGSCDRAVKEIAKAFASSFKISDREFEKLFVSCLECEVQRRTEIDNTIRRLSLSPIRRLSRSVWPLAGSPSYIFRAGIASDATPIEVHLSRSEMKQSEAETIFRERILSFVNSQAAMLAPFLGEDSNTGAKF